MKIPVEQRSPYDLTAAKTPCRPRRQADVAHRQQDRGDSDDGDATIDATNITDDSKTIDGFCQAEHISRGLLYKAWKEGWGPEFYWAGNSRRITHRARIAWHQQREAAAHAHDHTDI